MHAPLVNMFSMYVIEGAMSRAALEQSSCSQRGLGAISFRRWGRPSRWNASHHFIRCVAYHMLGAGAAGTLAWTAHLKPQYPLHLCCPLMLFAAVFVSGVQCAASASEQASSRPMLVAQRSPFSSPHSSHSSPFSSPCSHNSDFSPSPRRPAQSRASPVVRHQHQHQSQGHDVHLAGGAAEPAYMSPLRHSKSLPADLNCAEKADPVPPPMRIVQRTASQPPAR